MGLEIESIKLLITAKELNVNFERTITLGRQRMLLRENELKAILSDTNLVEDLKQVQLERYAESFFQRLGAKVVDALDASAYEGANVIHDLNQPLPSEHKSKYDVVFDGGTLEHIFNFPTAIKNCMEMIKVGGHYISLTPTNNFLGHGFYQFSPELYYRIFNASNGFKMVKMYFYTRRKGASVYEVLDPMEAMARVGLVNSFPSFLFIIAQKIEETEIFEKVPQQYDYEHFIWKREVKNNHTDSKGKKNFLTQVKQKLPWQFRQTVKMFFKRTMSRHKIFFSTIGTGNPKHIKKVKK
jgi:SAM-dependent methyltransferase